MSARTGLTTRRRQILNFPYLISTNGTNNDISVTAFNPTGDSGQSLTAWCWMRGDMTQVGRYCFGQFDFGGTANARAWLLFASTGGQFQVILSSTGVLPTKNYVGNGTILDNRHHFLALTWNNGTLKLYVDGEEVTVTKVADGAMTAITNFNAKVALGHGYTNGAIVGRFGGLVGRCGTAPVVATADQIRDLFYEGVVSLSSTSGLWNTTEGSGTTLTDTSGNNRNMTITNGTWSTNTPRKARTIISSGRTLITTGRTGL
jgi:hypothetical protein